MLLVVFYTFNYIKDAELTMLRLSIYSIYKELNDKCQLEIRVYTETPEILNKMNFPIKVIEMSRESLDFNVSIESLNGDHSRFNFIGHSRIPLFNKIMNEDIDMCIYLDNDTLLLRGFSERIIEGLKKTTTPIIYCKENVDFDWWFDFQGSKKGIDKYGKMSTFNNGIIISAKNEFSIDFFKKVENKYFELQREFGHLYGHDLSAISIVFHDFNLDFKNTVICNEYLSPFWHYFLLKIHSKSFLENFLAKFGELNIGDYGYIKENHLSNSYNLHSDKNQVQAVTYENGISLLYGVLYEPKFLTGISYPGIPNKIKLTINSFDYNINLINMLNSIKKSGGFCAYPGLKIKKIKQEMRYTKAGVLVKLSTIILFSCSKNNRDIDAFMEKLMSMDNTRSIIEEFLKIPNSIIYPDNFIDCLEK